MRIIASIFLIISYVTVAFAADKVIIAHRGASGYVPEHTIAAKAMAYAMGADYIEQDVVMTKDDQLVVLHDYLLDRVTDVQKKFPDRKREDGRYYVIDFTYAEIRTLNVSERYRINDAGEKVAVFPGRFPLGRSYFKVHTLEKEIELIQGLNISTGGDVGLYPEAKSPAFHLSEGKDLSRAILTTLKNYGYSNKSHKAYFQTFEIEELKRVYETVLPKLDMDVRLVQLMGGEDVYKDMITEQGIKALSGYADGIGPSIGMIVSNNSEPGNLEITDLVPYAHKYGLEVHPYTFRKETFAMPKYATDFDDLLDIFLNQVGVDGVFSDFPDLVVKFKDGS